MQRSITGILIALFVYGGLTAQTTQPKTHATRQIMEASSLIKALVADTSFVIGTGVEETDLHYINTKGQPMHVFILRANLRNRHVRLRLLTASTTTTGRKTLRDMIGSDAHPDRIIAGVNADFFDLKTGVPIGILYKDGIALKDSATSGKAQQGLTYLGVLKRRHRPVIGSKNDKRPRLLQAAGGGVYLVKDHQLVPQDTKAIHPRTVVGITDRHVAYFVVADGRNAPYSNGMNYDELAQLLKALQVKDAINLDGGGSSTFIIRNPQSHELEVRNRPSDGSERTITNGWVITAR